MEFWKTRGDDWTPEYDGKSLPSAPVEDVELLKDWSASSRLTKAGRVTW